MPNPVMDITLRASFDDKLTRPMEGVSSKLGTSLLGVARAAAGPIAGFLTLRGLAQKGLEFENLAEKAQGVRKSFENLSASAGKTADVFLGELRTATRGTISDIELMTKTNQAALLIGEQGVRELPQLIEIARASAAATGQDFNFLFDSIVLGVGRQSKMILDNLGIIVDVEKANKDYAGSLGKQAGALTEAERKQAFFNAVLQSGNKLIQDTGAQVTLATDAQNRMSASSANLGLAIGNRLLPAAVNFKDIMADLTTAMANLVAMSSQATPEQNALAKAWLEGKMAADEQADSLDQLAARLRASGKGGNLLGQGDIERIGERARTLQMQTDNERAIQAKKNELLLTDEQKAAEGRKALLTATGDERLKIIADIAQAEANIVRDQQTELDRLAKEADERERARWQAKKEFVTELSTAQAVLVEDIAEQTGRNQTAIGRRFLIAQIQLIKQSVDKVLAMKQAEAIGAILGDASIPLLAKIGPILAVTAKFAALRAAVGLAAGAAIGALSAPLEQKQEDAQGGAGGRTGRSGGGVGTRGRVETGGVVQPGMTQQIFLTVEALDPATLNWRQVTQDNIAPALNDLASRRVLGPVVIQQT